MIRLGTVGTSSICDSFLSGAALTNEYELTAVYSRKYETGKAFAIAHGNASVFTDIAEMAKSNIIDAVYIASPNALHYAQSKIFLENGKHVICEKPIVTRAEEYVELKALADRKGLVFMEAIIPRHIKGYSEVKRALKEIGKIREARICYLQRSSRLDAFNRGEHVNIFDMSLHAGTLMDLGVYCVYGAVDLLGMPDSITAEKQLLWNGADGAGEATFCYGEYEAHLSYSKIEQDDEGSLIIGDKGSLKIKMVSQYTGVSIIKDGNETLISPTLSKSEQMRGEAQRFADYINRFDENCKDYEAASELCLNVHRCMDQIKIKAGLIYSEKI